MVVPIKSSPPKETMSKREFVGNRKEFRIEANKEYLRIIGNGNKIRIVNNCGPLEVIGNATNVKIVKNSAEITYTGNNGKVYLGKESSVTDVNYIGNNGILKVVSSSALSTKNNFCHNCNTSFQSSGTDRHHKDAAGDSPAGSDSDDATSHAEFTKHFGSFGKTGTNNFSGPNMKFNTKNICLQIKNNISLPDLQNVGRNAKISNTIKIASSTGNIVVNNFVNV